MVSNELRLKIHDLPTRIFATYGMTETITHIAIKPLNKASLLGGTTWQSFDYYITLPGM